MNQTVNVGTVGTGSSASVKYYSFTPTVTGNYHVTSTGSTGPATMDLLNANWKGIGFSLVFNGNNFKGTILMNKGETYIFKCYARTGTASFSITVTEALGAWLDNSTAIGLNQAVNVGTVSSAAPKLYKYTPTVSGTYVVTSTGSTGLANLDILNVYGSGLGFSITVTGNNFRGVINMNAGTTYILRCNTRSGSAAYSITVTKQ